MATKTFKWYMHDDDLWESQHELKRMNPNLTDEDVETLVNNNPFYEITLTCEFDPHTGVTEIVRVDT